MKIFYINTHLTARSAVLWAVTTGAAAQLTLPRPLAYGLPFVSAFKVICLSKCTQ